jgi:transposase
MVICAGYSESFKIQLVRDIEMGKLTPSSARKLYDIRGHSTILRWQRKFGTAPYAVKSNSSRGSIVMNEKELLLQNEINELKKELEDSRFRNVVLETFIDVADRELGTNLRKKCGAKPAKK